MAKLTLSDLASLQNETSAIATINDNNTTLETALENTLSRDGTSPNSMGAALDMNSNRIINLPAPVGLTEPLRLQDTLSVLDVNIIDNSSTVSPFIVTLLDDIDAATARATLGVGLTSFSEGSVLFVDSAGATTEDNDNFFWDNTNKRLGIALAGVAPTAKLDVGGGIKGTIIQPTVRLQSTITGGEADVANWTLTRNATFTSTTGPYPPGGPGFVNNALRVTTNAGANNNEFEWGILSILNTASLNGENVALYGQANGTSTGRAWGGVYEINMTGGGVGVGLEINARRPSGAHATLVGLDVVDYGGLDTAISVSSGIPALANRDTGIYPAVDYFWFPSAGLAAFTTKVGIKTSAPGSTLTVSENSATLPSASSGTIVHVGGADSATARLLFDGFNGAPSLTFRRSNGTAATPSAISTGMGSVTWFGYGDTAYSSTSRASVSVSAGETWTDSAQGTIMTFSTTPVSTTTLTERMRISASGLVSITGTFSSGAPVTKTADWSLADTENWVISNRAATNTVTLPAASSWTGRMVTIKTITAQTVVSASSNVVPSTSATAGTAILPATDGAWATLVSDGTNWVIMAANPLV